MQESKFQKAYSYIQNANSIALVCHINPDGDTVASGLALYDVLGKLGKNMSIFCDEIPPKKLSFFQNFDKINVSTEKKFDLAIAVDCSEKSRVGVSFKYLKHAFKTISIDHHIPQSEFCDYLLNDRTAAATAELVYDFIVYIQKVTGKQLIDDEIAKTLFAGIITDSGAFSFSNTTSETHRVASELIRYNFNADQLIFNLITAKTKNVFLLSARVLDKCKFYADDEVGIITFTKDDFAATNTSSADTEGIINSVAAVKSVRIAIALTEDRDKNYKVSIRTKEGINANSLAGVFGGGGHARASGCRISGYYEDVLDKLLKVCRDAL